MIDIRDLKIWDRVKVSIREWRKVHTQVTIYEGMDWMYAKLRLSDWWLVNLTWQVEKDWIFYTLKI